MIYVAYAIIFLSFYLIFYKAFVPSQQSGVSIYERLRGGEGKPKFDLASGLLGLFAPLNDILLKRLKLYDGLRAKLLIAKKAWSPGQFFSIKEWSILLVILLIYMFDMKLPVVIAVILFIGFIWSDLWLAQMVNARKESIARVLPETVDLLSLCVGAGLDFMAAVRWIIRKTKPNPMIQELKTVLDEINIGKSRTEALRDMAKRLDIPDVTSFVRTLVQADRMGTPVEEAFVILSDDSRTRRFQRGRRAALKAPIKMLIPLIFCIMPIVMIIVAGPIFIRFFSQDIFNGIAK